MFRVAMIAAVLLTIACGANLSAAPLDRLVIEFTQDGCQPCAQQRPIVETYQKAGYDVREINLSRPENAAFVGAFGLEKDSTPLFVVLDLPSGKIDSTTKLLTKLPGPTPAPELKALFDLYGIKPKPAASTTSQK